MFGYLLSSNGVRAHARVGRHGSRCCRSRIVRHRSARKAGRTCKRAGTAPPRSQRAATCRMAARDAFDGPPEAPITDTIPGRSWNRRRRST